MPENTLRNPQTNYMRYTTIINHGTISVVTMSPTISVYCQEAVVNIYNGYINKQVIERINEYSSDTKNY